MGTAWKWVWMYEVGGRKLGYLHPMETASRAHSFSRKRGREFAVTDGSRGRRARPSATADRGRRAVVLDGVPDFDAVDAFVHIIQLKHQLLARPE